MKRVDERFGRGEVVVRQVNPTEGGTMDEGAQGEHRAWQISALQNADIRAKETGVRIRAMESCPNAGQSWMPN